MSVVVAREGDDVAEAQTVLAHLELGVIRELQFGAVDDERGATYIPAHGPRRQLVLVRSESAPLRELDRLMARRTPHDEQAQHAAN